MDRYQALVCIAVASGGAFGCATKSYVAAEDQAVLAQARDQTAAVKAELLRFKAELHALRAVVQTSRPPEVPIGSVVAYAGSLPLAPHLAASFLMCDGTAVSAAEYPDLFQAIGWRYGYGESRTPTWDRFQLPDYRGLFLRGVDAGRGRDPDAASREDWDGSPLGPAVGSIQHDAYKRHAHEVEDPGHSHTYVDEKQPGPNVADGGGDRGWQDHGRTSGRSRSNIRIKESSTTAETRPRNVYVYFLIRAR